MKNFDVKENLKEDGEKQIISQQKIVDFDVKEFTIELIISKYTAGLETDENDIFIPEYQRSFVWSEERKSKFIESVLMGLPIPYIFTADLGTGRLEMVDGTQRLRTLVDFKNDNLRLKDLEILTILNGFKFSDLLKSRQRKFLNSTLRMITLTEKSDEDIRYLMFERINTGSDTLKAMETRKGIFAGKFIDFVYKDCANHSLFKKLTKFTNKLEKRGEPQELIIRFFAYSDRYLNVSTGVNEFLNSYTADMNKKFNKVKMFSEFERMLRFVNKYLPDGFTKTETSQKTPRVRWDSISVGINLALRENPNSKVVDVSWLNSEQYKYITTHGGQNAPSAIKERIEFVKNKILSV